MNTLLSAGLIFILGFTGSRLLKNIRLPAVTTFLVVGIILGPQLFNLIDDRIFMASDFFSNVVLGVIAFGIGENFRLESLRKGMKQVIYISLAASIVTSILVSIGLIIYFIITRLPWYPAIILGAAAAATAPAAVVLIIREYRSRGVMTDLMLKVVAVDDAWGLILAAIGIAVARALSLHVFQRTVIFLAIGEIFGAFIIGAMIGYSLSWLKRFVRTQEEFMLQIGGMILINVGICMTLQLSVLLSSMMMGIVLINKDRSNFVFFETIRTADSPLYLMFFVLAGAHIDFSIIPQIGIAGLIYLVGRIIGKIAGARFGAHLSQAPENVRNWFGLGLMPQAGVALGIGLVAKSIFPQYGDMIFSIIAATSVIFEIAGPLLTKMSLQKGGEIAPTE